MVRILNGGLEGNEAVYKLCKLESCGCFVRYSAKGIRGRQTKDSSQSALCLPKYMAGVAAPADAELLPLSRTPTESEGAGSELTIGADSGGRYTIHDFPQTFRLTTPV
jgi:hypothetical protein